MQLERLVTFFATNPAARLLRSPHAAHVAYFLHQQFKADTAITVPHAQLTQRLAEFLDQTHLTEPECLTDRPENYLNHWTTPDCRWLRRYHDTDHAEPVYELTPHTEEVLQFLDQVLERGLGFVGTESRLKRIIDALADIVVRSSDDPERRLSHLRAERAQIDREIEAIESGTSVETYSATAIRERFADAVADLASLQGDFRAVEESFKVISRDVQQRHSAATDRRGEILGYALEAEDRLKNEDQGISFNEFVRLILSPAKQEQLEAIISQLDEIDALAGQAGGLERVRGMITHLADEAEKVLRTTRRLSATLRRLLDARSTSSRQRVAGVLREIKAAARQAAEQPPDDSIGLRLPLAAKLVGPMERTFWTPPAEFDVCDLVQHLPDELDRFAAFRELAELQRLDWPALKQHIAQALEDGDARVPLPQLLACHRSGTGAIELMGYLQLAYDDGHHIDRLETDLVSVEAGDGRQANYEIPRVVFLAPHLREARQPLATGATS